MALAFLVGLLLLPPTSGAKTWSRGETASLVIRADHPYRISFVVPKGVVVRRTKAVGRLLLREGKRSVTLSGGGGCAGNSARAALDDCLSFGDRITKGKEERVAWGRLEYSSTETVFALVGRGVFYEAGRRYYPSFVMDALSKRAQAALLRSASLEKLSIETKRS